MLDNVHGFGVTSGFGGLLTIVFIILKLTEIINWSWMWILSPLWIGILIWFTVIAVAISVAFKLNK